MTNLDDLLRIARAAAVVPTPCETVDGLDALVEYRRALNPAVVIEILDRLQLLEQHVEHCGDWREHDWHASGE